MVIYCHTGGRNDEENSQRTDQGSDRQYHFPAVRTDTEHIDKIRPWKRQNLHDRRE